MNEENGAPKAHRNFRRASRRLEMLFTSDELPSRRPQLEEHGEVAAIFRIRDDEHGVPQVFTDPPDKKEF